ncbi:hypothetical protein TWF281_005264 [Arthrobotrys megalospora]
MVHIRKSIFPVVSIIGLVSSPIVSANILADIINFQDLALPLGTALTLTNYAGFVWQNIKAFKPSGFSLENPLGASKPFAILNGVNPSNGGLTGTITSTSGPISLKSLSLICCQSTDPTRCDQPVPCTILLTGKDANGAKILERSFTATPAPKNLLEPVLGPIVILIRNLAVRSPAEGIQSLTLSAVPFNLDSGSIVARQLPKLPITLPISIPSLGLPTGVGLPSLTKFLSPPTGLPLPTGGFPTGLPKLPGGGIAAQAPAVAALSVPRPNPTFSIPPIDLPFPRAKVAGLLKPKLQNKVAGPAGTKGLVFTVRIYELVFD